jgi:hypothetical protein
VGTVVSVEQKRSGGDFGFWDEALIDRQDEG